MRHLAVIGMFAVFLAAVFIVGQAAVVPIFDKYEDRPEHDLHDAQGDDLIVDGSDLMDNFQDILFKWIPAMIMVGIPVIAFLYYIRLTTQRGPGL